ncbi:hypothetical protein K440DRAFT_314707 [Wilcoxina mikolae CBS 423.85]|nr:hypothetical protein K440DRAFT_314707 [Wilcoxina mikolae CBS 423.85]
MSHRPWEDTPSPRSTSSPPPPPPPPPAVLAGIPPPPGIYDYRPPSTTLPPLSISSRNPNGKRRRSSTTAPPPIPTPPSPPRSRNPNTSRSFPSLNYTNHSRRFKYPTASSLAPLVAQIYNAVLNPAPGTPKTTLPDLPTLDDIGTCLETVLYALPRTKSASATTTTTPGSPPPLPPTPPARDTSQLSEALSRSQKRAEILEKKMVTLEAENDQTLLECERLQNSIEILEKTAGELRMERDEARRELRVSGDQWGRIVGNAAKLERGLWLEVKRGRERDGGSAEDATAPACKQCVCLRKRVDALEGVLEDVKLGGAEMGRLVQRLGALGQQVEGEVARGLAAGGACGGKGYSGDSGGKGVRERLSVGPVDSGGGVRRGVGLGVEVIPPLPPPNPNDSSVCSATNLR